MEALLKKAKDCVCYSICFILIIIDLKIVMKKLLSLIDLTKAQTICIHDLSEIIMVNKNKNLVFTAF